ncbi:MAG: hypothetical protein U5Q44_08365 [Dehalococcoidia bacterium]|nr:hypothetical protein [Dehalococcoidia bacterium]
MASPGQWLRSLSTGPARKFVRFFSTIKEGTRFDQALEEVYGFDLAGFEDAFREAHGLEPRSSPDATEPPAQEEDPELLDSTPAGEPTRPPLATTGGGDDGTFDTGVILIVGSAALFGLLGLLFYLLSMMLSSNRSAAASGPGTSTGSGSADETDSAWRTPPPLPPSDRGDRLIWREDDDTDRDERS